MESAISLGGRTYVLKAGDIRACSTLSPVRADVLFHIVLLNINSARMRFVRLWFHNTRFMTSQV